MSERKSSGKFTKKAEAILDVTPCPETGEPLRSGSALSGDSDKSEEPLQELTKSFTTMVEEQTGGGGRPYWPVTV